MKTFKISNSESHNGDLFVRSRTAVDRFQALADMLLSPDFQQGIVITLGMFSLSDV